MLDEDFSYLIDPEETITPATLTPAQIKAQQEAAARSALTKQILGSSDSSIGY